ncbi:TnsA endonuclease N-terminal domain-containing protein [Aerophototrophica crusticola]|uniref:TnsA endonuclease N-terminal domain-containing protein n=1 Tax=Aerophototrophica crusticola TaxID=1709002 RepID=UPI00384D0CF6
MESTLERDFALLQRFDLAVATLEEQPVRIRLPGGGSYVPDFLVTYRDARPPRLVEVKYSTDKALLAGELEARFAAARAYAADMGWRFEVATEQAIRTARLENAKFLLPYRDRSVPAGRRDALIASVRLARVLTVRELAASGPESAAGAPALLPDVWTLVARLELAADLDQPVAATTPLTLPRERSP